MCCSNADHLAPLTYAQAQRKVAEQQIVAEVEARVAAERIAEQNASERHRRKLHISEKILTLTCPRCGQAFVDFSGCMALTCSRTGCGCGFCAICQMVRRTMFNSGALGVLCAQRL